MKPTQDQLDQWAMTFDVVPYSGDLGKHLTPIDIDEMPHEDEAGRRRCEGFGGVYEGVIRKEWTNFVGALHGAAASYIVDTCTSALLVAVATPTFWGPPMLAGVSLTLDVEYFHPAMVGTRIHVKVRILRCTTTLANVRCDVVNADTGQLLFSGKHIKSWKAGKADGAIEEKVKRLVRSKL